MSVTQKGRFWEFRHSLWIAWSFVPLAGFISFFYIGIRSHQRKWLFSGLLYLIPYITVFIVKPNSSETLQTINFLLILVFWLSSMIHSFMARKTYLILLEAKETQRSKENNADLQSKPQISREVTKDQTKNRQNSEEEKSSPAKPADKEEHKITSAPAKVKESSTKLQFIPAELSQFHSKLLSDYAYGFIALQTEKGGLFDSFMKRDILIRAAAIDPTKSEESYIAGGYIPFCAVDDLRVLVRPNDNTRDILVANEHGYVNWGLSGGKEFEERLLAELYIKAITGGHTSDNNEVKALKGVISAIMRCLKTNEHIVALAKMGVLLNYLLSAFDSNGNISDINIEKGHDIMTAFELSAKELELVGENLVEEKRYANRFNDICIRIKDDNYHPVENELQNFIAFRSEFVKVIAYLERLNIKIEGSADIKDKLQVITNEGTIRVQFDNLFEKEHLIPSEIKAFERSAGELGVDKKVVSKYMEQLQKLIVDRLTDNYNKLAWKTNLSPDDVKEFEQLASVAGTDDKIPTFIRKLREQLDEQQFALQCKEGKFVPIANPPVILQAGEQAFYAQRVHISQAEEGTETFRAFAGTRINIAGQPIYVGGSAPISRSYKYIDDLGTADFVVTDSRIIVSGETTYSIYLENIVGLNPVGSYLQIKYEGKYSARLYKMDSPTNAAALIRGLIDRQNQKESG